MRSHEICERLAVHGANRDVHGRNGQRRLANRQRGLSTHMRLTLTASYYLTDENETPRLVHRHSGREYGPYDIAQLYPSWSLQSIRQSVRRAARTLQLNDEESSLISAFVEA